MTTFNSDLFAKLEDGSGYDKTNSSSILNPYVDWYNHENQHSLQDVLAAESIQMRGVECYYLPRKMTNLDKLFGEDPNSVFDKAWKFAAYLNSFEGYSGGNSFFTKFGMQVNDEITLTINPNLFKYQTNDTEPVEGDLIYFPMDKSLFEIVWVEPYTPFYQLGQNVMRKITAQKFIYSGEEITPELQRHDEIILDEFSELDLEPISILNNKHDINVDQYSEVEQINKEGIKAIDQPYIAVNNKGIVGGDGPFDNFMDD